MEEAKQFCVGNSQGCVRVGEGKGSVRKRVGLCGCGGNERKPWG